MAIWLNKSPEWPNLSKTKMVKNINCQKENWPWLIFRMNNNSFDICAVFTNVVSFDIMFSDYDSDFFWSKLVSAAAMRSCDDRFSVDDCAAAAGKSEIDSNRPRPAVRNCFDSADYSIDGNWTNKLWRNSGNSCKLNSDSRFCSCWA